jgi:heterodisulfide reductase subunit A-like polyferredoxin
MLTASGFRAAIDENLCKGCGKCTKFCQFHAITVVGNGSKHALIDAQKCMGCGVCVSHCPQHGIALLRDEQKGEPLEIVKLMEMTME